MEPCQKDIDGKKHNGTDAYQDIQEKRERNSHADIVKNDCNKSGQQGDDVYKQSASAGRNFPCNPLLDKNRSALKNQEIKQFADYGKHYEIYEISSSSIMKFWSQIG